MRARFRPGLLVALLVALVLVSGVAIAASVAPAAFKPAGTTRYAMVARPASAVATTNSTTFVDVPGMSTSITVPPGRTAEVIITFSGMVNTCYAMEVRALVGTRVAKPPVTQFMWDVSSGAASHAFTFFRAAKAGTHTVKVQWRGITNCNQQFIAARSMTVTANIH